jgi:uncharacterized membrane protein YhhN
MKRYLITIYFIFSVVEIVSHVIGSTNLHSVAKPMLMIWLAAYYVFAVPKKDQSKLVLLALAFSWLGDLLLMFQEEKKLYFIGGLLSFMVAHIFYVFAYKQHRLEDQTKALIGVQRFRFSFPIILAGTGLITVLYNQLGDLRMPVIIYALVLVIMVLNALFRFGHTSTSSFAMVFFGATLFMISDSLIAVDKFLEPIAFSGLWIMATYTVAQYFIVQGLIRHK